MAELRARRLEVALRNHPKATGVLGDLRQTWPELVRVAKSRGAERPDLLCACPPCQGMSTAKSDRGLASNPDEGSRDPRNLLVLPIAEVVRALSPRVVVLENVTAFFRRLVRHPQTGRGVTAAALLIEMLEPFYIFYPIAVDLADFGVPQTRRRAFLTFVHLEERGLASFRSGGKIPYPEPLAGKADWRCKTLEEALKENGLPPLDAKSLIGARDPERALHCVPVWDERRYHMIESIPPRSGRSAWENNLCISCGPVDAGPDDAECALCRQPLLRPVIRDSAGTWRLIKGHRRSSYRRMYPDRPAATVTTASGKIGSDFTLHPWENRVLSPLECAIIQTFPADFQWVKETGIDSIREMIGEAVPPLFTELHGGVLAALLRGRLCGKAMMATDFRQKRAVARLREAASMHEDLGASV